MVTVTPVELPARLNSHLVKDIPVHTVLKLRYLWRSGQELATVSQELSHLQTRAFALLAAELGIALPEDISGLLCCFCHAIQLPGQTCSVRLRRSSRKKSSQLQSRDAAATHKDSRIKNHIIRTCGVCSQQNSAKPMARKDGAGSLEDAPVSKAAEDRKQPSSSLVGAMLLSNNGRRSSVPGPGGLGNADFIALSGLQSPLDVKVRDVLTGAKRPLNLLEREALLKVKKRRSSLPALSVPPTQPKSSFSFAHPTQR